LFVVCAPELMQLLITGGAVVGAPDVMGMTALHQVFRCKEEANLVKLLLGAGADAESKDRFGHTPLHVAAAIANADALKLILASARDVNPANEQGLTPRDIAALLGRQEAMAVLDEYKSRSAKYDSADSTAATLIKGSNNESIDNNLLKGSVQMAPGYQGFSYTVMWDGAFGRALVEIDCVYFAEPGRTYVVDTYGGVERRETEGRIYDRESQKLVGVCVY
jgi:hypothetical protein